MKDKKRSAVSWIAEFAEDRKTYYALSVLTAVLGVLCGIAPYFFIADIIKKLLAGTRVFGVFAADLFFIMLLFVALYSLYKGLVGIETLTLFKIILISALIIYVSVSAWILFSYKIIIKNNFILSGKTQINMSEIKIATVKVDRVGGKRFDRCLEIITKDKRKIKYRLIFKRRG